MAVHHSPSTNWPIGFAHRGARAQVRENTLDAFSLALRLGASGLESDVWLTADGIPVLDHDGVLGLRRRPISRYAAADLPDHIPTLAALYAACGTDFHLSLDVKDAAAASSTVEVARAVGASDALWLCHPDWSVVADWRKRWDEVRLVDSTRLRRIAEGPERRAAALAAAGIDAVNLHHSDWSAGLVTLFHRFDLRAFGWDAQHRRILDALLAMGCDAVYCDHVDRMTAAIRAVRGG